MGSDYMYLHVASCLGHERLHTLEVRRRKRAILSDLLHLTLTRKVGEKELESRAVITGIICLTRIGYIATRYVSTVAQLGLRNCAFGWTNTANKCEL